MAYGCALGWVTWDLGWFMAEGRWNPEVDLEGDGEGVEGGAEDEVDVVAIIRDNKYFQKEMVRSMSIIDLLSSRR